MDDSVATLPRCHRDHMDPTMPLTRPGDVVSAAEADARGVGPDALRSAVRAGSVVRLRRGVYADGADWQDRGAPERHLLRVRAAALALDGPVFSHRSAAAVWRIPVVGRWSERVEVTVPAASGGRSRNGVRRHTSVVLPRSVDCDGLRVTTPARTVVDLARTESFVSGVVAADHGLRQLVTNRDELTATLDELGRAWGVRQARRVLAVADPRSQSPGESLSRARMVELGFPLPELQHTFVDDDGPIGCVDFWWPQVGLVGEFDGRIKYRIGGIEDRRTVEERVWAEKLREDRLRTVGLRVVRWTWADALDGERLGRRLTSAGLTRARH